MGHPAGQVSARERQVTGYDTLGVPRNARSEVFACQEITGGATARVKRPERVVLR